MSEPRNRDHENDTDGTSAPEDEETRHDRSGGDAEAAGSVAEREAVADDKDVSDADDQD